MASMGNMERRFADIVWEKAPIRSPDLVDVCAKELNWAKSTTYTVLRKLCDRGIFRNEDSVVSCVLSREEYMSRQSVEYVEGEFEGSLPDFIAAFTSGKPLKKEEIERIREIIDRYGEG